MQIFLCGANCSYSPGVDVWIDTATRFTLHFGSKWGGKCKKSASSREFLPEIMYNIILLNLFGSCFEPSILRI